MAMPPGGPVDVVEDPKPAETTDPAVTVTQPAPSRPPHAVPRFKLSYRSFSMANLDNTSVHFDAGQIDLYAASRRWIRIGVEAEGGAAKASLDASQTSIYYGALGLSAGIQYPWRVTPFVEGRFAAGLLGGNLMGYTAVTYAYLGGVDAGIDLYLFSRFYISAALGWVHPVYHGVDYAAMKSAPLGGMKFKDISDDAFTFKVGIGI